jgi:hypothetical protein
MTLTFLILAGQVKVKGQLGQMAKCLEDSDKRISDLARMFFTELATKDNAVYNHFVDMFSLLSAEKDLDEDAMKRVVKFLASFIEKVVPFPPNARVMSLHVARINTRSSSPTNWPHASRGARQSVSGPRWHTRCHCYSTRTRRYRKRSPQVFG